MLRAVALLLAALLAGPAYAGGSGTGSGTRGGGGLTAALAVAAGVNSFSRSRTTSTSISPSTGKVTTRSSSTTSFATASGGSGSAFAFRQRTTDPAGHVLSSFATSSTSFNAPRLATVSTVPAAIVAFPGGAVAVVSRSTVLSGGTLLAGAGASATVASPGATFTTVAVAAPSVPGLLNNPAPARVGGGDALPLILSSATLR